METTTPGQAEQDDPGAIDTKEPRNDCTPTIRGHQIWRLSIPAEFTPSVRKDYEEFLTCTQEMFYMLATWQGRLCCYVLGVILAIVLTAVISTSSCD